MAANAQAFFGLGAQVGDYSPHSHVTDYGSQIMMTQSMPVSGIGVATPLSAYSSRLDRSRLEYDYIQVQQPQARDQFEA